MAELWAQPLTPTHHHAGEQRSCHRPHSTGSALASPRDSGLGSCSPGLAGAGWGPNLPEVPTDPSCHHHPLPSHSAEPVQAAPRAGKSPGTEGSQPVAAEGLAEDTLCPLSLLRDRRVALGKQQDHCLQTGEGRRSTAWAAGACAVPQAAVCPPSPARQPQPKKGLSTVRVLRHRQAQPGELTAVGLGTCSPPAPGQDQAPDGLRDA